MEVNAKVKRDGNQLIITEDTNGKTREPLFPYVKKATQYRPTNATSLFSKYIAFYSTLLSSLDSENRITTNRIQEIGKEYKLNVNTVERCIKDLVTMEELIKVQRGIYMVNPKHISVGRTAEASLKLIKKAEQIINNNTIINNPIIINNPSDSLLQKLINKNNIINLENKHEQDRNKLEDI